MRGRRARPTRWGLGEGLGLAAVFHAAALVCDELRMLAAHIGGEPRFEDVIAHVVEFVERPCGEIDLPLDIRGTAFQRRVWEALRSIPTGETATYAQIAERIGRPWAARAVGRACAANRLAVAIPCHRVVKRDGALSGYRWGVERKRALLDRETPH